MHRQRRRFHSHRAHRGPPHRRPWIWAVLVVGLAMPAGPVRSAETLPEPFKAVVGVLAQVPGDARTAPSLGTERQGSGVVIDADGLVLTIGYLILEATAVRLVGPDGDPVPAAIVAYDHDTGFGLLRAARPLGVDPVALGESAPLKTGDKVIAVSHGGPAPVIGTRVVSRRPFAGYWEYLLEDAIFTAPPHMAYGGAALFGADGRLVGIGSLLVNDAAPGPGPVPGNMFVPIDGLKPIMAELLQHGRRAAPSHPWLGVYTDNTRGRLIVTRLAPGGPGEKAGLRPGDVIIGVGGRRIADAADFFRKVWSRGDAGVEVPIDLVPANATQLKVERVVVRSMDRYDWLKLGDRR